MEGEACNKNRPPSPINVYGQTKLDGELAIQASGGHTGSLGRRLALFPAGRRKVPCPPRSLACIVA